MAEINHKLFNKYLNDLRSDSAKSFAPVYLLFGEEMLVKSTFDQILDAMLPQWKKSANYDPVEGAVENIHAVIESINTFSLLPGTKVVAIHESRIFDTGDNKNRLLDKAKKAYDDDDIKKAAKYVISLMGHLNLSFEDVDRANRAKTFESWAELKQVDELLDSVIEYCQENNLQIPEPSDQESALQRAVEKGFPPKNHLIITTDMVDRRRSLYKTISEQGIVIDCGVPKGDRRADKLAQDEILLQKKTEILKSGRKQMDPAAYQALIDMTGFDLRTFCGSLEKLIDYSGDRNMITVEDVKSVLKRTKKDPIYDFTNAIADRQLERALFFLNSLLSTDFHPLQILAAIINQVRKLVLAKDFTQSTIESGWRSSLSYPVFQQSVMPSVVDRDHVLMNILENWENFEFNIKAGNHIPAHNGKGQRKKKMKIKSDLLLARNPKNAYPVYQLLKKSERYSKEELMAAIGYLYETDAQLKTSSQDPKLILERLILKLCHRAMAAKQG